MRRISLTDTVNFVVEKGTRTFSSTCIYSESVPLGFVKFIEFSFVVTIITKNVNDTLFLLKLFLGPLLGEKWEEKSMDMINLDLRSAMLTTFA